ncbi:MAG: ribonuclease P protein component [Legionella sp.]|nr:MAG: ribonuclease P protein component [Legionella sp.]
MFDFKKTQRLLNKTDYDRVFEKAKKMVTPNYIVLYRKNNLGYARLGLALSKKMVAKAHDRNRIKRLLREGFRQEHLPSVDIIFLARSDVAKETNSNINTQLSKTWENITLYYDK